MEAWIAVVFLYMIVFAVMVYVFYAHYDAYEKTKQYYRYTFINNSHKYILLTGDIEVKSKSQVTYLFTDLDKPRYISTLKSGDIKWNNEYLNFDEVIVEVEYKPSEVGVTPVIVTITSDTYWNVRVDTNHYNKEIAVITSSGDTLKNPTMAVSNVSDILTHECHSINYRECESGNLESVRFTVTRISFNEVMVTIISQ